MISYIISFAVSIGIMVLIMGTTKLFSNDNDTYLGAGGIWGIILIVMELFSDASIVIKIFNIFMIIVKLVIALNIVETLSGAASSNHATDFDQDANQHYHSESDANNDSNGSGHNYNVHTNDSNVNRDQTSQRNANVNLDEFLGATQVHEHLKTKKQQSPNGEQTTTANDHTVIANQHDSDNHASRSKAKDVFIFNQKMQVKQYAIPNFTDRFITIQLGDTTYAKLLNLYRHYGPERKNLFSWTVKQIKDTDYLLKRLNNTGIEYPVAGYENFKHHFYNQTDDNGKKISFFSFYNNQENGDEGEQRIVSDIEASAGIPVLSNINMPSLYLNADNRTPHEGSTQIDVILVCQYGIFALESKNYDADAISIEGNGKKELVWDSVKQRPTKIDQQFIRTYKNDTINDSDSSNMIGHQTFIHEQALIEYLDRDPKVSLNRNQLRYITHSVFVYANPDIDENGINELTGSKFYLGNHSEANQLGWKVKALPAAGCWDWVTTYHNNDSLDKSQIKEVIESLQRYDHITGEKMYTHMIFKPDSVDNLSALDNYQAFLGHWYGYNKHVEQQLKVK